MTILGFKIKTRAKLVYFDYYSNNRRKNIANKRGITILFSGLRCTITK